jgi:hypothetical protein
MEQPKRAVAAAVALDDLYREIEAALHECIDGALEYDWNEDYLSRSVCRILRDRSPFQFFTFDGDIAETRVIFKKNTGRIETSRGDIGVVVRLTTKADRTVVGFGYLEAKRRYTSSRNYDELRWDQLQRIESNAPHAMLLMYDFEDVRFNEDVSGDEAREVKPRSRAVVIPIAWARAIEKRNIELYQSCTPLAHQVCYRYLHGLDLEMMKDPAELTTFFSSGDLVPAYLLEIDVVHRERHDTTPKDGTVSVKPSGGGEAVSVGDEDRYVAFGDEEVRPKRVQQQQAPARTMQAGG